MCNINDNFVDYGLWYGYILFKNNLFLFLGIFYGSAVIKKKKDTI